MNFQILKKIVFLIKSKTPINIILKFFVSKIKDIFLKKQKKMYKRENQNFLQQKSVSVDYFSSNCFYFFNILKKMKFFNYLEIGSFEGNSSMFIARTFSDSKVFCIDNWEGTEEYYGVDFKNIEKNFDKNTKNFTNIFKIKKTSDRFFFDNNLKFEVIYIDGYHKGNQVYKDINNSWKALVPGGLIILDDYIWKFFTKIEDNPCYAINSFLKTIKGKYKVLLVSNSQIFIQKMS